MFKPDKGLFQLNVIHPDSQSPRVTYPVLLFLNIATLELYADASQRIPLPEEVCTKLPEKESYSPKRLEFMIKGGDHSGEYCIPQGRGAINTQRWNPGWPTCNVDNDSGLR